MRSPRTATIIVLPVSRTSVKNTAPMIDVTMRPMSASCLIQFAVAACSVIVFRLVIGVGRDRVDRRGDIVGIVDVIDAPIYQPTLPRL